MKEELKKLLKTMNYKANGVGEYTIYEKDYTIVSVNVYGVESEDSKVEFELVNNQIGQEDMATIYDNFTHTRYGISFEEFATIMQNVIQDLTVIEKYCK